MPQRRYTAEEIIGKLRDELLEREIFCTLGEAQVLVERWGLQYNHRRPHSSLGNRLPAPEAYLVPNWGSPFTAAATFRTNIEPGTEDGAAHHDPAAC